MNKKAAIIAGVVILGLVGGIALSKKSSKEEEVSTKSEMVTVVDGNGEVEVKTNPETVVSFDYGVVDALDNMGIEVDGLPKGGAKLPSIISKYDDAKYADLGDLKEPNFEAINQLKPDLIIISGRQLELYDKFAEIAPTLYLNIDGEEYMEDFTRNMNALGKIFGKEDEVSNELANIEEEMKSINKTVTQKGAKALTVMVNEGSISAFSDKSRFGMIYNQLGFENVDTNIEDSNHGQQVTFEYIVEQNPEYLFVVDRGDATGGESTAKALFENDLMKSTDAYINKKIVYLSSQAWYIVSGGLESTRIMLDDIVGAIK